MTDEKPPLTDEQLKEIAARRAEALKRVQEMHQKANGGKSTKQPPPRGRPFRHQGR
jgi:hypothetical protein